MNVVKEAELILLKQEYFQRKEMKRHVRKTLKQMKRRVKAIEKELG